ncbi:protein far1-related sequence 5-like isoform x2 [Gigaspora margarita]|uniref:Protein far1-related sequence 5-like isoform x2 n=1 Tax=Gigaspora margarita TaxID=4874 RepID=A0A8H4EV65_GIGMA|nr:protein far1-related sequence 5-like isoform x2 [Gigaspora margarita]
MDHYLQHTLGENYNNFLSQFYFVCNCLNKTIFIIKWNQLNKTFSCASSYLIVTLDKIKELWEKHLSAQIYLIQKAQLDIDLEYNIALILPEQYEGFNEDFIYENNPISNDYADFAQISLESIIYKSINKTKIIEVCQVTYLTHNSKSSPHFVILFHNKSHICTCLMILNCGLILRIVITRAKFIDITSQHSYITQLSTILSIFREDLEDTTNSVNKKIEKRHLYSDLFGLGRKIAQIATEKQRKLF